MSVLVNRTSLCFREFPTTIIAPLVASPINRRSGGYLVNGAFEMFIQLLFNFVTSCAKYPANTIRTLFIVESKLSSVHIRDLSTEHKSLIYMSSKSVSN